MKNNSFWLLLATLLASVGCLKEEAVNESVSYSLNATVEDFNPETRVGFEIIPNEAAKFFWTKGDAIAVGKGNPFFKFTTTSKTGSATASFTGNYKPVGYAVFPYARVKAISGDELTYEFASEYKYGQVDTDFFNGMSVDLPMWASVEDGKVMFKHLGGVIAFKFTNLGAGNDQTFTLTADQKISGNYTVNLNTDTVPQIETVDTENEADKKMTIKFSLSQTQDAVFYIPVPVGTYKLTAVIKNGDKEFVKTVDALTVIRAGIRHTTVENHGLEGNPEGTVSNASQVKEAMDINADIVLTGTNDENNTIELPKKAEDANVEHKLTISSIANYTKNLTIIEETEAKENENSIEKLTVKIPQNYLSSLVVDMPETTVRLLPNGNEVTLNEVTASTAENTLIVGNDLKIKKLIVNKGNIRLEAGAKIDAIERGKENSNKVIVIYEGTKPKITVNEDEVEFLSASHLNFFEVVETGGKVTLTEDLLLTEMITIKNTVEIDLNQHTITGQSTKTGANFNLIDVHGTLTIKNGTITTEHKGENMGWGASTNIFNVTAGGVLNIENATCRNLGGSDMAFVAHLNNWGEVTLNVDNSELESPYVAVRVFNSGNDNNNVTIQNTKLKANNCIWIHNYTKADFGNDENKVNSHKELLNFNDIFNANNTFEYNKSAVRCGFTNSIFYDDKGMELIFN